MRILATGLATQTNDPQLLERYSPGPVALLIVVSLLVVVILLIRNMGKQIRRVDFDETATDDAGRAAGRRDTPESRRPGPPDTSDLTEPPDDADAGGRPDRG